jgi:hypothetical protein
MLAPDQQKVFSASMNKTKQPDVMSSRKHTFHAAMSQPQHKTAPHSATASDSDMESTDTDSTRSTTSKS